MASSKMLDEAPHLRLFAADGRHHAFEGGEAVGQLLYLAAYAQEQLPLRRQLRGHRLGLAKYLTNLQPTPQGEGPHREPRAPLLDGRYNTGSTGR